MDRHPAWSAASIVVGAILVGAAWMPGPALAVDPGSLDRSFGDGGTVVIRTPGVATAMTDVAGRADGGSVVAGYLTTGVRNRGGRLTLRAFTRAGRPDHRFGVRGRVDAPASVPATSAPAVRVSGGKILVIATLAYPREGLVVARFNADGQLDPAFAAGGVQMIPEPFRGVAAPSTAVQRDGKILVAGGRGLSNFGHFGGSSSALVTRLAADGTVDETFGSGGTVRFGTGPRDRVDDTVTGLAQRPDGAIVLAGDSTAAANNLFGRLIPDGSADGSFGAFGQIRTNVQPGRVSITDLALTRDGKIVIAGLAGSYRTRIYVGRFNPDLTIDPTFGLPNTRAPGRLGYITTAPRRGLNWGATEVHIDSLGRIVAVGGVTQPTTPGARFAVARYLRDGTPDQTFGQRGTVTTSFRGRAASIFSAIKQPRSRLLAIGTATLDGDQATPKQGTASILARYNIGSDRTRPSITLRASTSCASRGTRVAVRIRDASPLRSVAARSNGRHVRAPRKTRFTLRLRAKLRRARITIYAEDTARNRASKSVRFPGCPAG